MSIHYAISGLAVWFHSTPNLRPTKYGCYTLTKSGILVTILSVNRGQNGTNCIPQNREVCITMKAVRVLAVISLVAVFLGGILMCGSQVWGENAGVSAKPDILILVNAQMKNANWVSITYPNVVKHSQAQMHLSTLVAETGWRVTNTTITDESVMSSGKDPMTSVQFMTPQVIDPAANILPVEPVIKAYKDYANIQLIYIVPQNARLRAMGSYENKYVTITFNGSPGTYRYGIHVKNPSFQSLNLPTPGLSGEAGTVGGQNTVARVAAAVLIVLLAIGIAILAFMFTSRAIAGRGGTKSG